MNNNSNNCGDCGTTCSECGRPWAICKQDGGCGCNKCKDIKFCEYGRMANGCIREKQPGCPMQAVIPSVTVESIEGIKNLADCLVHVSDINTTFYIDDKHRPIITWAGPIDIPGYDMEGNPNNYRDQIVTDVANQEAVIYDKSGRGYVFGLVENIDLQEQVNNKLDAMVEDGTLGTLIGSYVDEYVSDTNARLEAVEESDATQTTEINNILAGKNGLIGIARSGTNYWRVYSPDGTNFYTCGEILPSDFGHDASHLCKIGDYYYYVSTNRYKFSTDLINWSDEYYIKDGRTGDTSGGQAVWGNFIMYDESSEKVYAYSAFQYNSDTFVNAVGNTSYYFKICYQEGTLNEDHTITWNQNEQDLLFDQGESYIDPFVIKHPTLGWIMAYKDEKATQIKISKLSSKLGPVSSTTTAPAQGVEAPKLVLNENHDVVCYVDGYAIADQDLLGFNSGIPYMDAYFYVVANGSLLAGTKMGLYPIKEGADLRHMGLMKCTNNDLVNIQKIGVNAFPTYYEKSWRNGRAYVTPSDGATIINYPNVIYILSGTKTITFKTPFINEPFVFTLAGNADITVHTDSWVNTYSKGRHLKGDIYHGDQIYMTFPDVRNITDGMRMPTDTTTP